MEVNAGHDPSSLTTALEFHALGDGGSGEIPWADHDSVTGFSGVNRGLDAQIVSRNSDDVALVGCCQGAESQAEQEDPSNDATCLWKSHLQTPSRLNRD